MSIIISLFIIGVSLSMDTFSISLSLGTLKTKKIQLMFFCFMVGILHFIMPLLGFFCGIKITHYLNINAEFLLGIVLLFIAIEILIEFFKNEEKSFCLNIINLFLLAISVSMDSFSTGLGIEAITTNILMASFIFSVTAFIFTYVGLLIGKYSSEKLGRYANIIGFFILLYLGIWHLF